MSDTTNFSVVIPIHNAAHMIGATLRALQSISGAELLEIIVVDDASTDGINSVLGNWATDTLIVTGHATNRGRSAARNTGAAIARGRYLLFVDADATPADNHFLTAYEQAIASGANLVFGAYASAFDDFWSRYEALSLQRALERFREGMHYSMSSRNFLIERSLFERCGGFDERYRHYGFEDRDLFMRALAAGARAALAEDAVIMHSAAVTLPVVMQKMHDAGRFSSRIFRHDHPDAYARLGYMRIDAGDHPVHAAIATPAAALFLVMSNRLEGQLQNERLPFAARARAARIASALSYLEGTRRREQLQRT